MKRKGSFIYTRPHALNHDVKLTTAGPGTYFVILIIFIDLLR
jgi:hypothetical protein